MTREEKETVSRLDFIESFFTIDSQAINASPQQNQNQRLGLSISLI